MIKEIADVTIVAECWVHETKYHESQKNKNHLSFITIDYIVYKYMYDDLLTYYL